MKERILFAPGIHAGEMLNSLALHGVNSIGLRIISSGELARYALMHAGVPIERDFVCSREEAAIVSEAVKTVPYFGKATYADIQELTACIRTLRCLVTDENEERTLEQTLPQGIFTEKNDAILQVFRRYMEIPLITECCRYRFTDSESDCRIQGQSTRIPDAEGVPLQSLGTETC